MKRLFFLAAMTAVSFGAFADLKYIEIESVINVPIIQVKSADGFEGILKANKIRTAYIQKESGTLFVIADNTYFSFMLNGYDSFEDYKKGSSRSFKNGTDYNEAKLLALSDSSEVYYFYKRNDFKSAADCRDAYKNGFCFIKDVKNRFEFDQKQKDQRGQRVVLSEISRAFTAENLKNFFSTVDISPLGSYSATTEIFKRK